MSEYLSITDLSSNGIKINDESMSKRTSIILKTGDKIAFAKTGGCYIFNILLVIKNTMRKMMEMCS